MRNEFETELVRKVERRKKPSKAWAMVALCAAILVSASAAITVVAAGNGTMSQDQLKDGTGDNCDGDGVCDSDCDGVCDNDCDGVCDNDADGDGVCDDKDE